MSEESIPERRGRKNASELSRSYHPATARGMLLGGRMRKDTSMPYQLACNCQDEMALQLFANLGRQEQASLPVDLTNYPLIVRGTWPQYKAYGRDSLQQA